MKDNYSYSSGRHSKRSDHTGLLRFFLIIMPLLIVAVIVLGAFFSYRDYTKNNSTTEYTNSLQAQPLYTDEELDMLLGVVNENNRLTADYVPVLMPLGDIYVNDLAYDELDEMLMAAEADGHPLKISYGYISYEEQDELNINEQNRLTREMDYSPVRAEAEANKVVPPAGCSESQTGLLIEFTHDGYGSFTSSSEYQWLMRNANTYGFIQRYPQSEEMKNKALFRFVGVENALKLRSFGMTLDEYAEYLSQK